MMWMWIASKLPRRLVYWCLVRAWAEFDPQNEWQAAADAMMWEVLDAWRRGDSAPDTDLSRQLFGGPLLWSDPEGTEESGIPVG